MRKKRTIPGCMVFLLLLTTHVPDGEAQSMKDYLLGDRDVRWQITADKLSYIEEEGIYVAEGDVVISRNGQSLSAQKATYNEKNGTVEVSGNVRVEVNDDVFTGETGVFDLKSYTGRITNGRLFIRKNNYYIYGDVMEKVGPNSYVVKGARVTTCDGDTPAWSITGSEVKISLEGYGTVKNAAFKIRDLPVFYIPFAIFPVRTKRQTGVLLPRAGYSNRNGVDIEVPFFWAISPQTDATFYERFMEERGLMQGVEYRYITADESKGIFLFDILSDRGKDKDLNDPDDAELSPLPRTNRTRYWLRSRADQHLPMGLMARLDADFVSDQDYLKEFPRGLYGFKSRPDLAKVSGRPVEEIQSSTRRSALRLSRDKGEYSLQALTSYHQRPENPPSDETPQPLAGLNFALLPRTLPGLPLSFRFNTSYDYIWRDVGLKGHSLSFSPELSYPMWFGRYLQFEPSVSYDRATQWLDNQTQEFDHQSKDAYRVRASFSTVIEKTFDFEWRSAKKIKHKFLPTLSYDYRAPKDEAGFKPWFEPIDAEGKRNLITLSFLNLLDARHEGEKGEVTYRQWGTFSLSQGFDLDESRRDEDPGGERNPFDPLVGLLTFMPFPDLDIDAEAHWDHDRNHISFADLSLELNLDRSGGRKDRFEVDYQFERGGNENLSYRFHVNLLYGFSAGTALRRDLNLERNIEAGYWLDYESQCWGVRFITERVDGVDSFMFTFRLTGLGGVLGG